MTEVPVFSVDISIFKTENEGLKIECPNNYSSLIRNILGSKGVRLGDVYEVIEGTANLYSIVEFSVLSGSFDDVCQWIKSTLTSRGYSMKEDVIQEGKDIYFKLHLINTNIYDRYL